MKIILHAGTPKTGTTALQSYLHRHRGLLLERGVLYPLAGIAPPPAPKHQWMIGALMHEPAAFTTAFEMALAEARPDTHTMILSSEGLFHRWWDFTAEGRATLHGLAQRHPVSLWVVFREPVSFVRSLYVQMLKNPRGLGPCYGVDLDLEGMLEDPRFAVHLDYARYIRDVEECLGAATVRPFRYDARTIIADLVRALGIEDLEIDGTQENKTVGSLGVDLLRRVNRSDPPHGVKREIVRLVERIDGLMDGAARPYVVDPQTARRIREMAAPSLAFLGDHYRLRLCGVEPIGEAAP